MVWRNQHLETVEREKSAMVVRIWEVRDQLDVRMAELSISEEEKRHDFQKELRGGIANFKESIQLEVTK